MKERTFAAQDYTYGFNGQEQDTELLGGAVSFKYRIHDPRIGRFLSVDPLASNFSYLSPYTFAANTPIVAIDQDGLFANIIVKYGIDVAINVATQMMIIYMFDENVNSMAGAWEKVNLWEAFGEGIADQVGSKKLKMAINSTTQMFSYIDKVGLENVTGTGLATAGGLGLIEPMIGDALVKYGSKAVLEGLNKMGITKDAAAVYLKDQLELSEWKKFIWDNYSALDTWSGTKRIAQRGSIFESYAWSTRYSVKGWTYVGVENRGYFKYIDFWKNGIGVSFKTTNATTEAEIQFLYKNIDDMSDALGTTLKGDNKGYLLREARLDVMVPEGNKEEYHKLWEVLQEYGRQKNVKVYITD